MAVEYPRSKEQYLPPTSVALRSPAEIFQEPSWMATSMSSVRQSSFSSYAEPCKQFPAHLLRFFPQLPNVRMTWAAETQSRLLEELEDLLVSQPPAARPHWQELAV